LFRVGVRSGAEMLLNPSLTTEMLSSFINLTNNNNDSLKPIIVEFDVEHFQNAYQILNEGEIIGKSIIVWKQNQLQIQHNTMQSRAKL
jgi:hypothetical protein